MKTISGTSQPSGRVTEFESVGEHTPLPDNGIHTSLFEDVSHKTKIRLIFAIPVLLVLVIIGVNVANYQIVVSVIENAQLPATEELKSQLSMVVILSTFGASLIAILCGAGLAYSIVTPLKSIQRTAESIATGDLTRKAKVSSSDEIGDLGRSFNRMIDHLNQFFQERNRYILESFSGGLVITDSQGLIVAMNSEAENVLSLSGGGFVGKSVFTLFSPAGENTAFLEIIHNLIEKNSTVSSKMVDYYPPGKKSYSLSVSTSTLQKSDGKASGYIINFRNLAKLKAFNQQMRRTDRLAAIGTFATGIAHEIRNPLGSIRGTAQLVGEKSQSDPKLAEYSQLIVKEVDRLDKVITEILDFAQPVGATAQSADLNQIVADAVLLARRKIESKEEDTLDSRGIELIQQCSAQLPQCFIQRDRIVQALLNLILNAYEATEDGDTITVHTALENSPRTDRPLIVSVSNTGSHIPRERIDKIFEPFYTTKKGGTGLGLPLAYQFVISNNGTIDVESDNDTTTFIIRLPVASY